MEVPEQKRLKAKKGNPMAKPKWSNKYVITHGPATGTVVGSSDLLPLEYLLFKNVKIRNGRQGGKHVQIVGFKGRKKIKTLSGKVLNIANTTLVGLARSIQARLGYKVEVVAHPLPKPSKTGKENQILKEHLEKAEMAIMELRRWRDILQRWEKQKTISEVEFDAAYIALSYTGLTSWVGTDLRFWDLYEALVGEGIDMHKYLMLNEEYKRKKINGYQVYKEGTQVGRVRREDGVVRESLVYTNQVLEGVLRWREMLYESHYRKKMKVEEFEDIFIRMCCSGALYMEILEYDMGQVYKAVTGKEIDVERYGQIAELFQPEEVNQHGHFWVKMR